eukprot:TRINITY_DN11937_c0_g1_i1.p1 TRINITY_DN11937_c0_g1~~TRINITY_DN11937_c0_g1_i1.p1  ORF type:complete len:156 (+),score=12.01 TRINITY_DN11937_c0_g1_i1:522-989(+)
MTGQRSVQYIFARNLTYLSISVSNVAYIDGTERYITHDITVSSSSRDSLSVCVALSFPYFASSLLYDPDMSVLTDMPGYSDGGQQSNDDSSYIDIKKIVILVVVGGVFLFTCLVLVVVVAAVLFLRQRHRNQVRHSARADSVAFEDQARPDDRYL